MLMNYKFFGEQHTKAAIKRSAIVHNTTKIIIIPYRISITTKR